MRSAGRKSPKRCIDQVRWRCGRRRGVKSEQYLSEDSIPHGSQKDSRFNYASPKHPDSGIILDYRKTDIRQDSQDAFM